MPLSRLVDSVIEVCWLRTQGNGLWRDESAQCGLQVFGADVLLLRFRPRRGDLLSPFAPEARGILRAPARQIPITVQRVRILSTNIEATNTIVEYSVVKNVTPRTLSTY